MRNSLKLALILLSTFSSFAKGESLKIPVVPYDVRPPHITNKVHKRCKLAKIYWKCIDSSEQKVTTSIQMDY